MSQMNFEELRQKIEAMKKSGTVDLSTDEDLSLAVMNLVSLEEHFFFTGAKTGKPEYYDFLGRVREMRKDLLGKLIPKHEGETWCISKHLLALAMRLYEVGTKLWTDGKKEEGQDFFSKAYEAYSLFWAVRLGVVDAKAFREVADSEKPWTYQDIVTKLVNCCDE